MLGARLFASRASFGVTRVTDLTRLDVVETCVVAAIRGDVVGESVTVSSGKGASFEEARCSALAEALERYCAEPRGRIPLLLGRASDLHGDAVSVGELPLAEWSPSANAPGEWALGRRLPDAEAVYVPANAVFFPYTCEPGIAFWFPADTTGIAVGGTLEEALCAALLECVERDAWSRAVALATVGQTHHAATVAPSALTGAVEEVYLRLSRGGLQVSLRDITAHEIPSYLCTIWEVDERGRAWAHLGAASHLVAEQAAERALVEAAQSRLVDIQGAREDLSPRSADDEVHPWFIAAGSPSSVGLRESTYHDDVADDVRCILNRLRSAGFPPPAFVDLSLAGVEAVVVRVICPGLEVWAQTPERLGARGAQWLGVPSSS